MHVKKKFESKRSKKFLSKHFLFTILDSEQEFELLKNDARAPLPADIRKLTEAHVSKPNLPVPRNRLDAGGGQRREDRRLARIVSSRT